MYHPSQILEGGWKEGMKMAAVSLVHLFLARVRPSQLGAGSHGHNGGRASVREGRALWLLLADFDFVNRAPASRPTLR